LSSRKRKLLSDTILYTVGEFGSKTISFFLVPFYTRYLTTAEYGIMDFINTTKSLILPMIYFQIVASVYRFLLDQDENNPYEVISTAFYFSLSMILVSSIIFLTIHSYFNLDIEYIYLIMLMFIVTLFSGLFKEILRGLNKIKLYSFSGIIITFITALLNVYFIGFLDMSYNGMILATTFSLGFIILFIVLFGKIYKYLSFNYFRKKILVNMLKYSLPLLPNVINWWIMNVSDRYLIRYFLGFNSLGIYAIANKFASILFLVNSIFYKSWQTSAITEYESISRDEYYTEIFNYLMKFQLLLVLIITISIKYLMIFLVGASFISAWQYVPFLLLGAMFYSFSMFYGTGYLSSKNTMAAFWTTIIGAIINIALNLLLISRIGIIAAAISTFIAYLSLWILRIKTTQKYFSISIEYSSLIMGLILIFVSMGLNYLESTIFSLLGQISILLIFLIHNKDTIIKLVIDGIKFIKEKTKR